MRNPGYFLNPKAVSDVISEFYLNVAIPGLVHHKDRHHLAVFVGVRHPELTAENCVIVEVTLNLVSDSGPMKGPYDKVARAKGLATIRTGYTSRKLIESYPELLQPGDTIYPGSAMDGEIVVALSGLPADLDEQFAKTLAAMLRVFVREQARRFLTLNERFIPDEPADPHNPGGGAKINLG